ncbi:hypothetical protein CP8484711_1950A, partial [Chlamydia psittaci 84-8471/1]
MATFLNPKYIGSYTSNEVTSRTVSVNPSTTIVTKNTPHAGSGNCV